MLESVLRPLFDRLIFQPITHVLVKRTAVSPNTVTLLAAITGCAAGVFITKGHTLLPLLLLILSGVCDCLDGCVSRAREQSSALGTVYDIVADRLVEFSLVAGFYAADPIHRAGVSIALLGSILLCVTSFLIVSLFSTQNNTQKSFHYSPGLIERPETFVFFGLMLVLPRYYKELAIVLTLLIALTTVIRLLQFRRQAVRLYDHAAT